MIETKIIDDIMMTEITGEDLLNKDYVEKKENKAYIIKIGNVYVCRELKDLWGVEFTDDSDSANQYQNKNEAEHLISELGIEDFEIIEIELAVM